MNLILLINGPFDILCNFCKGFGSHLISKYSSHKYNIFYNSINSYYAKNNKLFDVKKCLMCSETGIDPLPFSEIL